MEHESNHNSKDYIQKGTFLFIRRKSKEKKVGNLEHLIMIAYFLKGVDFLLLDFQIKRNIEENTNKLIAIEG